MPPDPDIPPALPVAAGEMSLPGTVIVAVEVSHPLQVANDPSPSEAVPSEPCQLVNSTHIVTESDVAVSKWLRLLIGTHSVLGLAHNMDVIVDTINQLAPTTNWVHVMEDEGFNIPDESVLNLMMSIHTRVCIKEPLPPHAVCPSLWKITEGQNCLMRFVDMCQSLQILCTALDSAPLPCCIKLATAASRKDNSLIEKWLGAKSDSYKGQFLEECLNLLKEIMSSTPMEKPQAEIMNLCWGSFPLFVEVCQSHTGELLPTELLDEHCTVRFGTIRNKLEKQVREMTLKYLIQPGSLDTIKDHVGMLLKGQKFLKVLISKEKQKVTKLKGRRFKYPFAHWTCEYLEKEYGPVILELKILIQSNDDSLKYLKKRLLKYFNDDDLLLYQVRGIFSRNKAASKRAGPLILGYNYHCTRAPIEVSWFSGVEQQVHIACDLLSGGATVLAEMEKLENDICDLNRRVTLLSEERTQSFHSHCQELATLAKIYEDVGILWKKLLLVTKDAKELCLRSKTLRVLLSEKTVSATRFQNTEQDLKEEKESSEICQELRDLKPEVELARKSFKEKIFGLPKVSFADEDRVYEKMLAGKGMSWRTRLLYKRYILGEMRQQGLDMCAFVSTVVMRESLAKREDARCSVRFGGQWNTPKQHFIKLSEYHLQDLYRAFCDKNKRKGSEKLDVCMERMRDRGVASESEYDKIDGDKKEWGFGSHRISYFEKMDEKNYDEACLKLDDAIVLVGTFGITKGYFSLGPDDVYDAPRNEAILETNAAGNTLTHVVVIVGYGVTPGNIPYYAFQNWYGPDWKGGKDGFGMVTCRSIRQLYSAGL